jgi:hypothetical protein
MRTALMIAVAAGIAASSLVAAPNGATAQSAWYGGQSGYYGAPGSSYPLISRPVSAAYDCPYGACYGGAYRTDSFPGGGGPG